jgi:hypothetical protein
MKKFLIATLVTLLLISSGASQASESRSSAKPGMMPGDLFYGVEKTVENLEVKLADVIGGPELKAKALANNAEERLAEAEALSKRNKTQQAAKAIRSYNRNIEASKKTAQKSKTNISKQINEVSNRNTERLEKVKEKVPETAKDAIQKALNNSKTPPQSKSGKKPGKQLEKEGAPGNPEKEFKKELEKNNTLQPGKKSKDKVEKTERDIPSKKPGKNNTTPKNNLEKRETMEKLETDESKKTRELEKPDSSAQKLEDGNNEDSAIESNETSEGEVSQPRLPK